MYSTIYLYYHDLTVEQVNSLKGIEYFALPAAIVLEIVSVRTVGLDRHVELLCKVVQPSHLPRGNKGSRQ